MKLTINFSLEEKEKLIDEFMKFVCSSDNFAVFDCYQITLPTEKEEGIIEIWVNNY